MSDRKEGTADPGALGDNLRRLLGMHLLPASKATVFLGISPQAVSELQSGKRTPRLRTLRTIAEFFELPMERLLTSPFDDLLEHELADAERFRRVQQKIDHANAMLDKKMER